MAEHPAENEIKQIFKRLLSIPTNKQCFDCSHSNPTWASVTYGVFLCIDCSAVHRSLGVHVTFIRSTQLDTNWTWLQLRAMQVGGNANARAFFQQHGCTTTDAQKKYHSRAATLYRDKLVSSAQHAMRQHGTKLIIDDSDKSKATKLHIESHHEAVTPEKKEVDFFSEHTLEAKDDFSPFPMEDNARLGGVSTPSQPKTIGNGKPEEDPTAGPNVEAALSTSPSQALSQAEPRKGIIGAKKPASAKKGKGLGAQRVQKDFSAIESRAQQVDKEKEELAKNVAIAEAKTKEDQEKQMANMRLAYQDMSLQRKKEEEKLMKNDPKKAEQFERLGMGFAGNKGISHSALSDMQTISQEAPSGGSNASSRRDFDAYGEKPRGGNRKDFFDDEFEFVSSLSSRRDDNNSKTDDYGGWGNKNKSGGWDIDKFDDKPSPSETISQKSNDSIAYDEDKENEEENEDNLKDESWFSRSRKNQESNSSASFDSSDTAQKKFGTAKAISSDQFFGNRDNDFETRQNLSRLEGQSSISSDDFFGGGTSSSRRQTYNSSAPDLQDIKDGVKQGVTKVAGKISSLANGVMSSLQDRYG
ncbi:ADP-ribosylation factor GTPase-activating protein 2-like isoform X2 [Physella acuta]|uniref:ADP-ribosylation factor GTPase-activating protein 2-like isoform X2 n=1 Tax=Physella acuta TaxID=109671 RepID=UPI0027DC469A|nr:ADP-ribosylation factor GTPase-activating protein 2-like isoform X2 [Physella acuta]